MIDVQNLTKQYGQVRAVDDLTFRVEPGVVTGFLGPNGAGKSTTMRMILGPPQAHRERMRASDCCHEDDVPGRRRQRRRRTHDDQLVDADGEVRRVWPFGTRRADWIADLPRVVQEWGVAKERA